jgi:hypothetical protein
MSDSERDQTHPADEETTLEQPNAGVDSSMAEQDESEVAAPPPKEKKAAAAAEKVSFLR